MAIETPAKIAIIGAGPIGLEAALYARFLGYEIEIFERGRIGERFCSSDADMLTTFRESSTSLGLAALEAQGNYVAPASDTILTCAAFAERYLLPLANTDLLRDEIRTQCEVVGVTRCSSAPPIESDAAIHDGTVEEPTFSVLVRNADGTEENSGADVVIDASGLSCNSAIGSDVSIFHELEVRQSETTGSFLNAQGDFTGPFDVEAAPEILITDEPDLYVLGSKSFGWDFDFQLERGHRQIRCLFAILGDRVDLDLYATIRPLGE